MIRDNKEVNTEEEDEREFEIRYSYDGWGTFYTKAKNEDEARENYYDGDGDYGDDDSDNHEITEIIEV